MLRPTTNPQSTNIFSLIDNLNISGIQELIRNRQFNPELTVQTGQVKSNPIQYARGGAINSGSPQSDRYWEIVLLLVRHCHNNVNDSLMFGDVLIDAINQDKTEIALELLARNASLIHVLRNSQKTLLKIAFEKNNLAFLRAFQKRVSDKKQSGFQTVTLTTYEQIELAARLNDWDEVKQLISDNNQLDQAFGYKILLLAIQAQELFIVETLLTRGITSPEDHNAQGENTALKTAVRVQDRRIAQVLINHGATPLAQNSHNIHSFLSIFGISNCYSTLDAYRIAKRNTELANNMESRIISGSLNGTALVQELNSLTNQYHAILKYIKRAHPVANISLFSELLSHTRMTARPRIIQQNELEGLGKSIQQQISNFVTHKQRMWDFAQSVRSYLSTVRVQLIKFKEKDFLVKDIYDDWNYGIPTTLKTIMNLLKNLDGKSAEEVLNIYAKCITLLDTPNKNRHEKTNKYYQSLSSALKKIELTNSQCQENSKQGSVQLEVKTTVTLSMRS